EPDRAPRGPRQHVAGRTRAGPRRHCASAARGSLWANPGAPVRLWRAERMSDEPEQSSAPPEAEVPPSLPREPDEDCLRLAEALIFASAEPVTARGLTRVLAD